ncbi:MAG: hypothetical protein AAF502_22270 [Bacteroidota bacterium]
MKNVSLRWFFLACLCIASFCSFMYLNLGVDFDSKISEVDTEQAYGIEADTTESTILLPDLEMLESVIEKGKSHLRLLPRF